LGGTGQSERTPHNANNREHDQSDPASLGYNLTNIERTRDKFCDTRSSVRHSANYIKGVRYEFCGSTGFMFTVLLLGKQIRYQNDLGIL